MAAILTLAYEQAFFSGRSLWQMIVGGVFDRFPELKVVFTETQAYWISVALDQFDRRVLRGDDWTEFAAYLQRTRAFSRLPVVLGGQLHVRVDYPTSSPSTCPPWTRSRPCSPSRR